MFEWNPFGKVTQAGEDCRMFNLSGTAIASTPVERGHSSDPSRCHGPFRTMVLIAGCLGLRVSEIVRCNGRIRFRIMHAAHPAERSPRARLGTLNRVSRDAVPLDTAIIEALLRHKEQSATTAEGWLFANPSRGKPYHQERIQKRHIRPRTVTGRGWTKPGRQSASKRS